MRLPVPRPLVWLRSFRAAWLRSDVVAGVTLAAYAVPVSLAYASLAGLPPQVGLYGYLFGCAYAFFGSSRQLAVGPTSAISIMVGGVLAEMSAGDPQAALAIASLAALMVGAIAIAGWLLRLGRIVNFISETVLVGFKAGAALVIASTQLPKLLGLGGGGDGFFTRLLYVGQHLGEAHVLALAVGCGALALLLLGERLLPGRPVALVVVAIAIVVAGAADLAAHGIQVVGTIAGGIPMPALPGMRPRDVDGLVPLAFACFLLAHVEGISVARTFALRRGYRLDPNQELLAIGVANVSVGLGHGYPVAGGMSQSAVNDKGGARTPLALVVASGVIAAVLFFFTGLFRNLPQPVLAAVVLAAVRGLVDVREFRFLRRASRQEFVLAVVALVAVLLLGVLRGVLTAAALSMLALIRGAEAPPTTVLGRIRGTDRFRSLAHHPDAERTPGVLVLRPEASLVYFNVENVRERVMRRVAEEPPPVRLVVLDLSIVPTIDLAGARMLATLREELGLRDGVVALAQARRVVRQTIRAAGLEDRLGPLDRRYAVAELVDRFLTGSPTP